MRLRKDKRSWIYYIHCKTSMAIVRYIICCLLLLQPYFAQAQDDNEAEEISVSVNVQGIGMAEMQAVIKNDTIYLPIVDIFEFLKIKNVSTPGFDSVTGFFLNESANYLIDRKHNLIQFGNKIFNLNPGDLIHTETNLYIRANYLGDIFSLTSTFNFRSLLVNIVTTLELPQLREKRLEMMRNNISRLNGELRADTIIPQKYPFAHFGVLDWSVISTKQFPGIADTRIGLGFGQVLAWGEVTGTLNYSVGKPLIEKDQYYQWRHVNNDNKIVKQVIVGKVAMQTVASIFAPVIGGQITNAPTTIRRSFGTYTIKDFTKAGWIVELYVNNVLVDYTKADNQGFYKFDVPLVYGNSIIRLRFYGPFGEEDSRVQTISIPFNFLPVNKLEYIVTGGIVEDDTNSRFSRAALSYGVAKRLTVGGGMEYLTSITTGNTIPFVNTSFRLGTSLLLYGEYDHGVRFKSDLTYRLPSNIQFDLRYTKYEEGQKAILNTALEERKAVISVPVRGNKFSLFSLFTYSQTLLKNTKYTTAEWLIAGTIFGVNMHLSNYGVFIDQTDPYLYASLATALRLPHGIQFTPEMQFEYNTASIMSVKGILEKHMFRHAFLGVSYEQNFKSNFNNLSIQFRYDFSFAQFGFATQYSKNTVSLQQSAKGSMVYDRKTKYFGVTNGINIGRGGILLEPYLDLNCNGIREADEPKVSGLKIRINGGHVQAESKDTTIRVLDMEPYFKYYIELNKFSFDNIAWQIKKNTISIAIVPNSFKTIEVPVAVVAEVSGTVSLVKSKGEKGLGQIYVCIYKGDSLVARTLSEPDGYFSYIGLAPGDYTARIDADQLRKINMTSSTELPVHVVSNRDGDVVEGLEFKLRSTIPEPPAAPAESTIPGTDKKTEPVTPKK